MQNPQTVKTSVPTNTPANPNQNTYMQPVSNESIQSVSPQAKHLMQASQVLKEEADLMDRLAKDARSTGDFAIASEYQKQALERLQESKSMANGKVNINDEQAAKAFADQHLMHVRQVAGQVQTVFNAYGDEPLSGSALTRAQRDEAIFNARIKSCTANIAFIRAEAVEMMDRAGKLNERASAVIATAAPSDAHRTYAQDLRIEANTLMDNAQEIMQKVTEMEQTLQNAQRTIKACVNNRKQ